VSVYCVELSWTIKVFEAIHRPSTAASQQVACRRGNVWTLAGRLRNFCVSRLSRHDVTSQQKWFVILKTALDDFDDIMLWRDGDEVAIGSSMCKEDEGTEVEDSFSTMKMGRVALIGKGR
jgi:hypothetical protein